MTFLDFEGSLKGFGCVGNQAAGVGGTVPTGSGGCAQRGAALAVEIRLPHSDQHFRVMAGARRGLRCHLRGVRSPGRGGHARAGFYYHRHCAHLARAHASLPSGRDCRHAGTHSHKSLPLPFQFFLHFGQYSPTFSSVLMNWV